MNCALADDDERTYVRVRVRVRGEQCLTDESPRLLERGRNNSMLSD